MGNYTCVVTNTVTKSSVQGPPTPLVLRVDGKSNATGREKRLFLLLDGQHVTYRHANPVQIWNHLLQKSDFGKNK